MIKAVVFDLDDTLIPEYEYVKSGFRAVSDYFCKPDLYKKFVELFLYDKKNVYGRAGLTQEECEEAVRVYRAHKPDISLNETVWDVLINLKKSGYKLGIITDGRPEGQRNKIEALGLDGIMDCIVITDELGGTEYRKPCAAAFELVSQKLNVSFEEMIYVGDNPAKDFYISAVLPVKTVRLKCNTESVYFNESYYNGVKETYTVSSLNEIVDILNLI